MGLTDLLARAAVARAHVLLVESPGAFRIRVAVERVLAARGWVRASSPADADVLAVCGRPYDGLAAAVDEVWDTMPGPRVRVDVVAEHEAAQALDDAAARLADTAQHRHDAAHRDGYQPEDHGDMDHGDMDHGDMDHGDMDHGDMDHGDMDMSPAGIPLASGADDRDGLEMDVLHVPLGPVLSHWPAGLTLRCTLSGDVVTAAEVALPPPGSAASETPDGPTPTPGAEAAARRLDAVAALLALAGWGGAERSALTARDACLDGDLERASQDVAALRRRLLRSRVLGWMLRDIGRLDVEAVRARRLPEDLAGDARDRLLALLDRAARELRGEPVPEPASLALSDVLPELVAGLELASVRLTVASLDLGSSLTAREEAHA